LQKLNGILQVGFFQDKSNKVQYFRVLFLVENNNIDVMIGQQQQPKKRTILIVGEILVERQ
jgi:hypothetical protein